METLGFAARLRAATRREHDEAHDTSFATALLAGELSRSGYTALSAQLYFVYEALERLAELVRGDELAGRFVIAELARRPALEADLEFLLGPDWRDQIAPVSATRCYVDRLEAIGQEWPSGFVAHHYTRYLGDLSGGQIIARLAQRLYGLADRGVRFYTFERVPKPKPFKDRYRELLDTTPWNAGERDRLLDEVRLAYRLNIDVLAELGQDLDRHRAAS